MHPIFYASAAWLLAANHLDIDFNGTFYSIILIS